MIDESHNFHDHNGYVMLIFPKICHHHSRRWNFRVHILALKKINKTGQYHRGDRNSILLKEL